MHILGDYSVIRLNLLIEVNAATVINMSGEINFSRSVTFSIALHNFPVTHSNVTNQDCCCFASFLGASKKWHTSRQASTSLMFSPYFDVLSDLVRGKCRKHEPLASVFYVSFVFSNSNARRVLTQCNTRLRLLYLLNGDIYASVIQQKHVQNFAYCINKCRKVHEVCSR